MTLRDIMDLPTDRLEAQVELLQTELEKLNIEGDEGGFDQRAVVEEAGIPPRREPGPDRDEARRHFRIGRQHCPQRRLVRRKVQC